MQAFVNTFWDLDRAGRERLTDPTALRAWLVAHRLLDGSIQLRVSDLERTLRVREGLRAMLFANNGADPDLSSLQELNHALRAPALFVQLDPTGPPDFRSRRSDLNSALGLLGTIVALAQLDGSWTRLKACPGPHCGWAFYDHSRNRSSSWCSMSLCGARLKAREYRHRQGERR